MNTQSGGALKMGNKWRACRLGDLFDVNPARPLKRGSVTPFIPMEALPPHARAVERIASREYTGSGMRFRNGDTLIARITPCLENGKTAFVSGLQDGEVAHGSTEYVVLAGKDGQSDSLFGYYLVRTPEFRRYAIAHMEGTSGRQRVPASAIEKYRIALPPLAEQRAIAQILGALDDKIELNRRINQTLEAMAQALFQSWFVDFDGVSKKDMQESELGLIPRGWRVGKLKELLVLQRGFDLPAKDRTIGDFSVIAASGHNGTHCAAKVKGPGVVTGRSGVLGKVFFEIEDFWPLNTTLWIKEFRAVSPCYAYELLRRLDFERFNAGSAVPTLNRNHVHELPVVVPPRECIATYGKFAMSLQIKVKQNTTQSRTLATLRDTLLPKLLSGELSVNNIAAENA